MNRHFFTVAFFLGALAVAWVGAGFLGTNLLALMVTALIAAVYGLGAIELARFRQASAALSTALAAIPDGLPHLGDWLASVPAALQNQVRLRIEGERIGLPGPALTPYLVGLLVMLGMLGTFLGMVVTLNGAVFALEGTTDLAAIRSAFAAPIRGLGLAFGTSVAGVASSAMLGLMSALCRRERMLAAQLLDTKIATVLRGFSLTHQRQEAFKALQFQSQALPAVVDKLQSMMVQMERMSLQLNERLFTNQESFHSEVKLAYTDLAHSVDRSLRDSLTQSALAAGASIKPVVEAAMSGIAQEAKLMHERMLDTTQLQLDGISARFAATASTVSDTWIAALAHQERSNAGMATGLGQSLQAFGATFEQRSQALLRAVNEAYAGQQAEQAALDGQRLQAWMGSLETLVAGLHREWQHMGAQTLAQQQHICATLSSTAQEISAQARLSASQTLGEIARLLTCSEELVRSRMVAESDWTEQQGERMGQLASLLQVELGALRDEEALRGHAAVERLGELQAALTGHLTTLGTALEDPIKRLIQTAYEAPRAAAEVIGKLRQEMSSSVARDNELLEERSRIMVTLNALLDAIHHASVDQRSVIDALVASSALALQDASSQFSEKVAAQADKLSDIAANVTSSAVEVSTLGETFSFAVRSFCDANEKLVSNLQKIEASMDKSMLRSDEQLAYYVAQARELIDLSTMSQKDIFEELRQLPSRQAMLAEELA
jgi:hypothetical protein